MNVQIIEDILKKDPFEIKEGSLIDSRYQVLKEVGKGGSSHVFLVKNEQNQQIALKLLKVVQRSISKEEAIENFKNEFAILSELNHPGIARIIDLGIELKEEPLKKVKNKFQYYFTTEFVDGQDFVQAMQTQPFEVIEEVAVQVLRALNYLHSRGTYHLDIKPQNILVQKNGENFQAKIIDFGLSSLAKDENTIAGTPQYMAPEVFEKGKKDGRSDLYSFGVILYKTFTRFNPFATTDTWQEMKRRHNSVIPKAPSEINSEIPPYWDNIIARLLAKEPSNRYPQASFVIRDINLLSGKNYEIETADTRRSYLLEKGRLIGRQNVQTIFKTLFNTIFCGGNPATTQQLLIIEGKSGTGKTRLLSEFKYHAQLQEIPVYSKEIISKTKTDPPYLVLIDEEEKITAEEMNLLLQRISGRKVLILWATSEAPKGWSQCQKLTLENFTEKEVTEYLMSVTGFDHPPSKLVTAILERTEGNPLFVTELLKTLLENNLILDSTGRWLKDTFEDIGINFDKIRVPETLAGLLQEKYLQLNRAEKNIMEWIAIYDTPITLNIMDQMMKIEKPQSALLNLLQKDLIERMDDNQGYFFRNLLFRDVITQSLPLEMIRNRHDQIETYLVSQRKPKGESPKEKVLFHRGYGTDTQKALDALLRLSDLYLEREKYTAAIETLEEAWQRAQNCDLYQQIEIEIKLAEGLIKSFEYKKGTSHYEHLKTVFDRNPQLSTSPNQQIVMCEKLGDLYTKSDAFDKALELFDAALEILAKHSPQDKVRRMILENYKANNLRLNGQVDEAKDIFLCNQKREEQELTPTEKKQVTNNRLADIWIMKKEYDLAFEQNEKDLQFFESIQDKYLIARSYYQRGDIFYNKMLGNPPNKRNEAYQEALASFKKAIELAKDIDGSDLILRSYNGMGNLCVEEGFDSNKAIVKYQQALTLARKLADYATAAVLELNIGNIYKKEKNYTEAHPHLVYAANTLESVPHKNSWNWGHLYQSHVELAENYRETGDYLKAEESLNRAEELVFSIASLSQRATHLFEQKSKLYEQQGKKEEKEECLKKAEELAKKKP